VNPRWQEFETGGQTLLGGWCHLEYYDWGGKYKLLINNVDLGFTTDTPEEAKEKLISVVSYRIDEARKDINKLNKR